MKVKVYNLIASFVFNVSCFLECEPRPGLEGTGCQVNQAIKLGFLKERESLEK